jgi:hypothetical protein
LRTKEPAHAPCIGPSGRAVALFRSPLPPGEGLG